MNTYQSLKNILNHIPTKDSLARLYVKKAINLLEPVKKDKAQPTNYQKWQEMLHQANITNPDPTITKRSLDVLDQLIKASKIKIAEGNDDKNVQKLLD